MRIKLSIIIPCYNSESTLEDTLVSVFNQNLVDWEAIIVNDGSPDNLEKIALKWVEKDNRFKYYFKRNGGLGSARNFGISKAQGKYILPLDSDNKVRPDFAIKAIDVLEKNENIGVVYGNAMYFGEKTGVWKPGEFIKHKMLNYNYIDACCIIRKSIFSNVADYDDKMPYQGLEDWDLWLSFIRHNVKFYYLDDITFDYCVSKNSMIKSFTPSMRTETVAYIRHKHRKLLFKSLFHIPSKKSRYFWFQLFKQQTGLEEITF